MKSITLFLSLILVCAPLCASNELPSSKSELVDIWGSVLYCRAIYEEPNISGRIYDGDRQSCNEANRRIAAHAQRSYSQTDTRAVFEHAKHKAAVIRYNTRSVPEAVTACRELCRSYND